jgi:predicted metalloendopeptidase
MEAPLLLSEVDTNVCIPSSPSVSPHHDKQYAAAFKQAKFYKSLATLLAILVVVLAVTVGAMIFSQHGANSPINRSHAADSPMVDAFPPLPPPSSGNSSSASGASILMNCSEPSIDELPLSKFLLDYIDSAIDNSFDPCEDFYNYTCSAWVRNNPLAAGAQGPNDRSFTAISQAELPEFIEVIRDRFGPIADFFDTCVDEAAVNQTSSLAYLVPWLQFIDQIDGNNYEDFWWRFGALHGQGYNNYIFDWGTLQQRSGTSDPNIPLAVAMESFLELSVTRQDDFLLFSNDNLATVVTSLQTDLSALYSYNFYDPSYFSSPADAVEKAQYWTNFFSSLGNSWDFKQLNLSASDPLFSSFSASAYLQGLGNHSFAALAAGPLEFPLDDYSGYADHLTALSLGSYSYMTKISQEIQQIFASCAQKQQCQDLASFKFSLKLHALNTVRFGINADYTAVLYPDPKFPLSPFPGFPAIHNHSEFRQYLCSAALYAEFHNIFLNQWFVENFRPGTKQRINDLADSVYNQLGEILQANDWLDTATRVKALNKYDLLTKNILYSTSWNNQDFGLYLTKSQFLTNLIAAGSYRTQRTLMGLEEPVDVRDPAALGMEISTVNAFYFPLTNSINLIPGLLQFPFFSPQNPMILNMAAYGWVIGHEMTHGFDNRGRLYDGLGRQLNWWSEKALDSFNERAQCLVSQYNNITVEGIAGDGSKTLGENIADNGGIGIAFRTYRQYMKDNKISTKYHPKYTNDQLFWLWAGQSWCESTNSQFVDTQKRFDVHSPAAARVRGPFSNSKFFAESWGCKADQYYGRSLTPQQCKVW